MSISSRRLANPRSLSVRRDHSAEPKAKRQLISTGRVEIIESLVGMRMATRMSLLETIYSCLFLNLRRSRLRAGMSVKLRPDRDPPEAPEMHASTALLWAAASDLFMSERYRCDLSIPAIRSRFSSASASASASLDKGQFNWTRICQPWCVARWQPHKKDWPTTGKQNAGQNRANKRRRPTLSER